MSSRRFWKIPICSSQSTPRFSSPSMKNRIAREVASWGGIQVRQRA